jgi:hypothetical protein
MLKDRSIGGEVITSPECGVPPIVIQVASASRHFLCVIERPCVLIDQVLLYIQPLRQHKKMTINLQGMGTFANGSDHD